MALVYRLWAVRACAALQAAVVLVAAASSSEVELNNDLRSRHTTSSLNASVTRIGFGSCSYPARDDAGVWDSVGRFRPQLWLWIGDAVYIDDRSPHTNTTAALATAFAAQRENLQYRAALDPLAVEIDGVWDDHDYGVNDGGAGAFPNHAERDANQALYLDFLGVPTASSRRAGRGLYSSRTMYGPAGEEVLVLLLDTRTFRDPGWLPSVAAIPAVQSWLPFSALFAAFGRGLSAGLGLGAEYTGDMLGEWAWLTTTLERSTAVVTIVVSSVQLLTTNPVVESWGHFPAAKRRLLRLFDKYKPHGLVVLSGDVHYAEVAGMVAPLEVTSSGITHTCATPFRGLFRHVCGPMTRIYSEHRWPGAWSRDAGASAERAEGPSPAYIDRNWGAIEFDWDVGVFNVSVRDHRGDPVLKVSKLIGEADSAIHAAALSSVFSRPRAAAVRMLVATGMVAFVVKRTITRCLLNRSRPKIE